MIKTIKLRRLPEEPFQIEGGSIPVQAVTINLAKTGGSVTTADRMAMGRIAEKTQRAVADSATQACVYSRGKWSGK